MLTAALTLLSQVPNDRIAGVSWYHVMLTRPIGPTWLSQACCARVDEMEKLAEPENFFVGPR